MCEGPLAGRHPLSQPGALEPRIDWFAFHRQDCENTFVDSAERVAGNETLQAFVTQREFAESEVALAVEPALAQANQIVGSVVFRAVDDAEVFAASDLASVVT